MEFETDHIAQKIYTFANTQLILGIIASLIIALVMSGFGMENEIYIFIGLVIAVIGIIISCINKLFLMGFACLVYNSNKPPVKDGESNTFDINNV